MTIPAMPAHGASWDAWAAGIDTAARNAPAKPTAAEQLVYVTARGSDSNDGLSLATAKATVAAALGVLTGVAAGNRGVIQLGYGTIPLASTELALSAATNGDDFGARGLTIRGMGPGQTILDASANTTGTALHMTSTSKMFINLEDFELKGPGSTNAGTQGIFWQSPGGNFLWRNVYVHDFETGINLYDCTLGTMVNVAVRKCATGLVGGYNTDIQTFIGCRFDYNGTAIDLGKPQLAHLTGSQEENAWTFLGCRISNNTVRAFYIEDIGASGIYFNSCYFESNPKEGDIGTTTTGGVIGIVFEGCYFNPTATPVAEGISVQNAARIAVRNCKTSGTVYTIFLRFYLEGASLDWARNDFSNTVSPVQYGTRTFTPGSGTLEISGNVGDIQHANGNVLTNPLHEAQVATGTGTATIWEKWTRRATADNTVGAEMQLRQVGGGVMQLGGITNAFIAATSVASLPTATVNYRGCLAYVAGDGATTDDAVYACRLLSTGAYSWTRVDNQSSTQLVPPFTSAQYVLTASSTTSTTSATLGNGSLRVTPWLVRNVTTLATIGAEITAIGDVGSKFRIGIYNDNGSGRPGTLALDAGQIAGDSATAQEIAVSITLQPGLYWVGGVVQAVTTTQPTVRCIATGWTPPVDVQLPSLPSAGLASMGHTQTGVTAALSGTFSFNGGVAGSAPRIFVKVA